MFKFWRIGLALVVFFAVMACTQFLAAPKAHASCIEPKETGGWVNVDSNTRSIASVRVQFVCQDVVLNGRVDPSYYVQLWGRCHPTNCNWGKVPAKRLKSGYIYATYDQGFANRSVWIGMSKYRAGELWVEVHTHFTDNRADYDSQDWFRKVS